MKFQILTKLAFLLLMVIGASTTQAQQGFADPAVTGAVFVPDSISIGETSELQVSFVNSGFTEIPASSIELTISTPDGYYISDGATSPAGAGGTLFTWTYLGPDIWRGSNIAAIPAFGGGLVTLEVMGVGESTTYEVTNINVQPTANFIAFANEPANDNLQPGLLISDGCPNADDDDMDGLTNCEEITGEDDLSTTAVPSGTSDPMNPCDPDPNAVASGDCDMDGNPNGTDPDVTEALAYNDTTIVVSTIPDTFDVVLNDNFIAGPNTSVVISPTNTTAGGTIELDTFPDGLPNGGIIYTALVAEEGDTVDVEYIVCNVAVVPSVCDTAILAIIVTDGCPNAFDSDMDGLTDCEEETGIDDLTTTAVPSGTSDPMNPCDPDPLAVASGDCDSDGNPNSDDPNPMDPIANNDTLNAEPGVMVAFNILTNDDFLAGANTSITNLGTGTANGALNFDPLTGMIEYTPLMSEIGEFTLNYEVCNTSEIPVVCAQATIVFNIQILEIDLGSFVWDDTNSDGIQDDGEPGLDGVVVNLYEYDGVGSILFASDTTVGGEYLFENLPSNDYYLEFIALEGMDFTLPLNGVDTLDSDVDKSNGAGTTSVFTLTSDDFSKDAGLTSCNALGDRVFYDTNENDIWDNAENGLQGLIVNLYREVNGAYILWGTEETDHKPGTPSDDGWYEFCTSPGTYYIEVVLPPYGLVPAVANVGGDETIDSDIDNANGPGTTSTFEMIAGEDKLDVGAGYYPMATIAGKVWNDENSNGINEEDENLEEGVVVEAYNTDGIRVATAITNSQGQYKIQYLQKAEYYLEVLPPVGYEITEPNVGSETTDSDIDHSNGLNTTTLYAFEPDEHKVNVSAGLLFGALPVSWKNVSATNEGDHHLIKWSTSSEINMDLYEIEVRHENQSAFKSIGKVSTIGTAQLNHYESQDKDVNEIGIYYYRIKSFDKDGSISYSDQVYVNRTNSMDQSVSVFPNPTIGDFQLEYNMVEDGEIKVFIRDVKGALVRKELFNAERKSGSYIEEIDMSDYSEGTYILMIDINGSVFTRRLMLMKN